MMRTIGAISDTPGLLRPQSLAVLAGCDPIIHAGDIGRPEICRVLSMDPAVNVDPASRHGAGRRQPPQVRTQENRGPMPLSFLNFILIARASEKSVGGVGCILLRR